MLILTHPQVLVIFFIFFFLHACWPQGRDLSSEALPYWNMEVLGYSKMNREQARLFYTYLKFECFPACVERGGRNIYLCFIGLGAWAFRDGGVPYTISYYPPSKYLVGLCPLPATKAVVILQRTCVQSGRRSVCNFLTS